MSDTRERMQEVAGAISAVLPPHTGFVLLAWDPKPGGRIDYVSNGDREGVRHTLRSFLDKATAEEFAKHIGKGGFEMDKRIFDMRLWAWVGEDEEGSGEVGLKQAFVPAGYIPLVACKEEKLAQGYIRHQLQHQARKYQKTISLVRFVFERIEEQVS